MYWSACGFCFVSVLPSCTTLNRSWLSTPSSDVYQSSKLPKTVQQQQVADFSTLRWQSFAVLLVWMCVNMCECVHNAFCWQFDIPLRIWLRISQVNFALIYFDVRSDLVLYVFSCCSRSNSASLRLFWFFFFALFLLPPKCSTKIAAKHRYQRVQHSHCPTAAAPVWLQHATYVCMYVRPLVVYTSFGTCVLNEVLKAA